MKSLKKILLLLSAVFLFGGCADKIKVTLLPEEGGKVGKIGFVDKDGKTSLIDKPWEEIEIQKNGSASTKILDEKTVLDKYGKTIAAMPQKPLSYLVYFGSESAEIDDASRKELDAVAETIKKQKSNLVVCAGHTDSMGEKEYNRILSSKRAESVIRYLIKRGVDKNIIETHYYGDANPLIKTAPGVPSPKNRRVEIIVK